MKRWFVYIVECADKTLYTGISNDIPARLKTHNNGKGSLYTSFRRPVRLVYTELCGTRSKALKREHEIKQYERNDKLALVYSSGF